MKRICIALLAVALLLTATACGQTTSSGAQGATAPAEAPAAAEPAAVPEPAAEATVEPAPTLPPEPQPAFDPSYKIMPWGDGAFMVLWYTEDAARIAMDTPAAGKYVLIRLSDSNIVDMSGAEAEAAAYFTLRDANGNEHALSALLSDPAYNPDMPRYSIDLVFDVPADMAAAGMALLGHETETTSIIVKLADVAAE